MDLLNTLRTTFWSTDIWLPPNTTWADIAPGSRPDISHADYRDLIWPIPLALLVMLTRYSLERFWISPIGKSIGIKSTRSKKAPNVPLLEKAYEKSIRLDYRKVTTLSKQLDLSERQIERWWRLRRAQDKPSTLTKFCENTWRCIYYTYSFIFGVIVLWDKPWFWDVKSCWYGYPHQSVSSDIWWYYMISMAFYWSLTVTQFVDVKRKDFWQMFIHHMVTLLLMSLSWICNLHRVGSLVLVIHDCADIFLEAAKLTKYANYQKLCDIIFGIFTVIWIITRLGFYPRIIYSTSVEAPRILPMFPAYYIFNSLLIMLLILHVVWTYMILKIVVDSLQKGLDLASLLNESVSGKNILEFYASRKDLNNNYRDELIQIIVHQILKKDLTFHPHDFQDILTEICTLFPTEDEVKMSGDIRSSDSEDVSESSESHTANNGTGTIRNNDIKKNDIATKIN